MLQEILFFLLSFSSRNSKLGNFVSNKENKHFPTGVHALRIYKGTPTAALNGVRNLRLRLRGERLLCAAVAQCFNFETLCNTRPE